MCFMLVSWVLPLVTSWWELINWVKVLRLTATFVPGAMAQCSHNVGHWEYCQWLPGVFWSGRAEAQVQVKIMVPPQQSAYWTQLPLICSPVFSRLVTPLVSQHKSLSHWRTWHSTLPKSIVVEVWLTEADDPTSLDKVQATPELWPWHHSRKFCW